MLFVFDFIGNVIEGLDGINADLFDPNFFGEPEDLETNLNETRTFTPLQVSLPDIGSNSQNATSQDGLGRVSRDPMLGLWHSRAL